MFVDSFEAWAWWYKMVFLAEGAAITVVSRIFADKPVYLFASALAVSSAATLGSAIAAPFLSDIADTIDLYMRLQNLLIFGIGLVQALPDSTVPSFADSTCTYILLGISGFTGLRFLMGFREKIFSDSQL